MLNDNDFGASIFVNLSSFHALANASVKLLVLVG